jgi:ParB-like chromosome segregation protein Spo0J
VATEHKFELHPLCTLFPRITGAEFEALKADILANGLRQPIVIHEGMILDGGNRYRACIDIGVDPETVAFAGGNLVSFVLSSNLHRRHLSPGQQAAIVASAQDWATAQTVGSNQHAVKASGPATLPDQTASTVASRAAQSGASERTQRMADKVAKESPALAKKVAHGEVSLPEAVRQISPPKPIAVPVEDEDPFAGFDPIEELETAQKENEALQVQIDALSQDDTGSQILKEVRIRQGIEARLTQEMETNKRQDKDLRWFGKQFEELRKVLGVDSNSRIVAAVKALLRKEAA